MASPPSNDVIIRQAALEDYGDLQEMGDVYNVRDYLLDQYDIFINDPNIYSLVAVIDSKIVGFYAIHLLDDGQTVIKRAARVHPQFRGQGLFHKLADALDTHTRNVWPSAKYETFITPDTADRAAKEFEDKGYVEVQRKRVMNMIYHVEKFKCTSQEDNASHNTHIRKMTTEDVRLLFKNDELVRQLFPDQRILNFLLSVRVLDANIPYLINDQTEEAYVSMTSSSASLLVFEHFKERGFDASVISSIDLVSFSHHHKAEGGILYVINFYCTEKFDGSSLDAHVKRHLDALRQISGENGTGILVVTFTPYIDEEKVVACLKSHGVTEVHPISEKEAVLYEKHTRV